MKQPLRRPERAGPAATTASSRNHWSQPWLLGALAGLLAATPLLPGEAMPLGCGSMTLVLGWLLLLVAWSVVVYGGGGGPWRGGPVLVLLVLLLSWIAISAVVMAGAGQPRATINMLWQWISFGCAFFLTRQLVATAPQRRAIVVLFLGMSVAQALVGYTQYFHEFPLARQQFERDPAAVLREAGISAVPGTPAWTSFKNRLESTEPFATFALANSLAGFLSPWLIVAWGVLITNWSSPALTRGWRWFTALTCLCIAGCWLLTKSRAAVLATSTGIVLLVLYGRRTGWRPDWRAVVGLLVAVVLLPIAGYVIGGLDAFVFLEASKSMRYRVQYWRATADLIADYPLFGCGPGNFQQYYTAYKLPEASESVAEPHNFAFEVWATAGTPAILLLLALLFAVAWQAWAAQRRSEGREIAASTGTQGTLSIYLGGVLGCLAGHLACAMFEGYAPSGSLIVLGVPAAVAVVYLGRPWVAVGRWPLAIPAIASGVLLMNLLVAGGISFAGVAQSLWVLLALLLGAAEDQGGGELASRRRGVLIGLAALVAFVLFTRTSYLPQTRARNLVLEGDSLAAAGRTAQAWERYRLAADADPWSPEGWQQIAAFAHQVWLASADARHEQAFRDAVHQLVRRNPRSNLWQMQIGRWWLEAYRRLGNPDCLQEAIAAYRVAIELYPNYNIGHAQLAWALHLAGESVAAAGEAEESLRLDSLNPHQEQKLAQQRIADEGGSQPPSVQLPPPGDRSAEQVMQGLRNKGN